MIICRSPKQAFKAKATELYEDYLVQCLRKGKQPEIVIINDRWVNNWLTENRLTQRCPNRKW